MVHPAHGTGKIVDVTRMDLVEGFRRYYVIEFMTKRLTLHVPIRTMDDSGIREVMSENKVDQVFDILSDTPYQLSDDYKARRNQVEKLLKSGRPRKIAEAVRELTWRKENARLGKKDSQFLSHGRELLTNEIAQVTGQDSIEIGQQIDKALTAAMEASIVASAEIPV